MVVVMGGGLCGFVAQCLLVIVGGGRRGGGGERVPHSARSRIDSLALRKNSNGSSEAFPLWICACPSGRVHVHNGTCMLSVATHGFIAMPSLIKA
jgi:hypothetical protein